ncbi:MAG: RagB/SusD family nutrient uptake outer membrane protein, partial [Prevotella sp.]|nr:RagB/SusD family nutrient uptake outer membrane protein [Prevotella sp.]
TAFNTQEGMEALVMQERQREFVGEGKRWFDLGGVRGERYAFVIDH